MDESYDWLKATVVQATQLSDELNVKCENIKDLEAEQEALKSKIAEAQQEKMK